MKLDHRLTSRISLLVSLILALTLISTRHHADTGTCGGVTTTVPFTDVMGSSFFCQIAEAYLSGLTNGTTSTTYSPSDVVLRDQMAPLSRGHRTRRYGAAAGEQRWGNGRRHLSCHLNLAFGKSP